MNSILLLSLLLSFLFVNFSISAVDPSTVIKEASLLCLFGVPGVIYRAIAKKPSILETALIAFGAVFAYGPIERRIIRWRIKKNIERLKKKAKAALGMGSK